MKNTAQFIGVARNLEAQHGRVTRLTSSSIWNITVHYADGHRELLHTPDERKATTNQEIADAFPDASVRLFGSDTTVGPALVRPAK